MGVYASMDTRATLPRALADCATFVPALSRGTHFFHFLSISSDLASSPRIHRPANRARSTELLKGIRKFLSPVARRGEAVDFDTRTVLQKKALTPPIQNDPIPLCHHPLL